ncbi:hypothetical protein CHS0354_042308 [Potamilus streckersoni]|uniref:C1q domain-containing protein n=1 Tax=Potamilus streckersoni TaxID=2493646 RepID=A0AAE0W1R7_9BIVA|nr:hypothetical protein CHS0354_042308 [Potamilus streckersoni]
MDIGFSTSVLIRQDVSNIEPQQAEMGKRLAELVPFKKRIQTAKHTAAIKDIKRTVTRKAAFTAMFSSFPVSITPGRSLQFDRVDYSEGNAYDAKLGIFTCPVSGTYFFFTNILSIYHSGQVETEIVVEGIGKGTTSAFNENNHAQGSTAAAVHCDAGQRVWVQGAYGSQAFGASFSSFTGYLLWPADAAINSN